MTPRMPSEPHSSRETSKPATFFITCPPKRSNSPLAVRSLAPNTKSRAAPAYTRRGPDRPAAITPPRLGSAPNAGGSKARNWPWAASAASIWDKGVPQRAVMTSSEGS